MKKIKIVLHRFVDQVPPFCEMQEGVIYVSMEFSTAIHKCCCGCGHEVVTPFSPTDWQLLFDGKSISLNPSIGNWSFKCKSHYWIKHNKVIWDTKWSKNNIYLCRVYDKWIKNRYFNKST